MVSYYNSLTNIAQPIPLNYAKINHVRGWLGHEWITISIRPVVGKATFVYPNSIFQLPRELSYGSDIDSKLKIRTKMVNIF